MEEYRAEPLMEKRIDLTQFEGIGEWEVEKRPDGGYAIQTGRDNFIQTILIKLPSLIAEIRKMYDREDALIAEAKDLVVYDEEADMWIYDAEKASNPGLDAMDFVVEISTMND